MDKFSSIGVFDSGIGGLSVLKQLIRFIPNESYIYLGDTARVPYGNKSNNVVEQYAKECTDFLLNKNVKLIVIACNTVSAVALDKVIEQANNIPVIGMIQPASEASVRTTVNRKIGIIGTRSTINSKAYTNAILQFAGTEKIDVFSQECPLFVPLVEEGLVSHSATKQIAEEYLKKFKNHPIDTLILGCTHYPTLTRLIRDILPNVNQIDSGEHAAVSALRLLAEKNLLINEKSGPIKKHNIDFYVTDYPNHFYNLSQQLLGFAIDSPKHIEIDKVISNSIK